MAIDDIKASDDGAFACRTMREKRHRHYGRLVFAMVARHFVDADELVAYLTKNHGMTEEQARALYLQV